VRFCVEFADVSEAVSQPKLLILDLDETLLHASETPLDRPADSRIGLYHVYKRPHLDAFLTRCVDAFEVAVWTSSSPLYAAEAVAALFPDPARLAFLWASDRCTAAFDHERHEYCWRKNLRKVRRMGYCSEQILVVDDRPEKWRQSYGNLVRVTPYLGDLHDDELPALADYLDKLRDADNVRTIEKRGWRPRS
jgi:TFIIF-interacting CTD phosphatase-like protein